MDLTNMEIIIIISLIITVFILISLFGIVYFLSIIAKTHSKLLKTQSELLKIQQFTHVDAMALITQEKLLETKTNQSSIRK